MRFSAMLGWPVNWLGTCQRIAFCTMSKLIRRPSWMATTSSWAPTTGARVMLQPFQSKASWGGKGGGGAADRREVHAPAVPVEVVVGDEGRGGAGRDVPDVQARGVLADVRVRASVRDGRRPLVVLRPGRGTQRA